MHQIIFVIETDETEQMTSLDNSKRLKCGPGLNFFL